LVNRVTLLQPAYTDGWKTARVKTFSISGASTDTPLTPIKIVTSPRCISDSAGVWVGDQLFINCINGFDPNKPPAIMRVDVRGQVSLNPPYTEKGRAGILKYYRINPGMVSEDTVCLNFPDVYRPPAGPVPVPAPGPPPTGGTAGLTVAVVILSLIVAAGVGFVGFQRYRARGGNGGRDAPLLGLTSQEA
jgi:hypothetical protein